MVRHLLFLVAFALVALAGGAASASAAPTVDGTFAVSDTPGKLARGSDGSIWVVVGGSKLAKVTPAGVVTETDITGVTSAKGITTSPDGNLWLTAIGQVVRIAPSNPAVVTPFPIASIASPQAITTGPDGNLWTASGDNVIRIPPAAPATATPFAVPGMGARGIASSGGLLWVADFLNARVVSVTTAGVATPYAVGGTPQEVGAGLNGQIAFAAPGTPDHVGLLAAGSTALSTDRPLADPFGIAFGADHAFWIAEFAKNDLLRLAADGSVSVLGGFGTGGPRDVIAGPGNTLWVSLETSKQIARVTGVDPPPAVITPAPPVVVPPVAAPPADTTAPAISGLRLSRTSFRRGPRPLGPLGPLGAAKPPATIALTLSEAASVTFTAQAAAVGVRAGRQCVAPTAKRRPTRRTGCTRFLPVRGGVTLQLPAGASTLAFSGQLRVPLRQAGIYRLTLVAKDAAGNTSAAVSTKRFALEPPRRAKR